MLMRTSMAEAIVRQRMAQKDDGERFHDENDDDSPSTWLVAPYFLMYFTMFIINNMVWPLQLLERSCISLLPSEDAVNFINANSANSCISKYITARNHSEVLVSNIYIVTLYPMVLVTLATGVVSIMSYFFIWKPLSTKCFSVSIFVPPALMMCQTMLVMHSETVDDYEKFKYILMAGAVIPSLHGGFQGVLFMFFHMSKSPDLKTKRELVNTSLDVSHVSAFLAMFFAGLVVCAAFDMRFAFVFFFQFTLGSVNVMYAISLLPNNNALLSGNEKEEEDKDKENVNTNTEDDDSDSSTDEFILADMVRQKREGSMWSKQVSLLKEAPMIFTESSYKMELIIIIEVCVFTVATIADMSISAFYFLETPFRLDVHAFGLCVAAQGAMKAIGMFLTKATIRYTQIKHGTLISLALANYIIYYILLSFASTKFLIVAVMFTNIFGGLALPTIFSFIKVNLRETRDTVLDILMICCFVISMVFNFLKIFVFEFTRTVFPGAVFAVTAALLLLCGIGIAATYFSTSNKYQRKSKLFADKLLNNNQ